MGYFGAKKEMVLKALSQRFVGKLYIMSLLIMFNAHGLKASEVGMDLSIITWNVWFDDDSGRWRYPLILNELSKQDADILLLQEVTPSFLEIMIQHPLSNNYYISQSNQGASYQNITLTKQYPVASDVLALESNMQRKALIVQLELPSSTELISVVNVHLESPLDHSWLRERQIQQIIAFVEDENNLLIGGDFNFGNGTSAEATLSRQLFDLAYKGEYYDQPTFDVENNDWAKQTKYWFESSRRLDRLYHDLSFVVGSKYSLFANHPVFEGKDYLSDHFGVRADFSFIIDSIE
ncbi:endonuclease/exonuclease/phosphatase family protein [Amphritea sp.]|uniref:endonuclease/exonuclease/phosphatase family protein n=1 Tax=Amphritea sp. TaxID=1872502 RepID=UPI0025B8ACB2|nr:endonuclease/exonuclease/phosphatase family protein [Amphritea sp.]